MGVVTTRDTVPRAVARRAGVAVLRRPLVALAGGALLIALGAGLIAAHVTVFALDETLIQQSAVHYASNLPHSLLHDVDARATNRLYSLVLSVAFRLFSGADAVRIDHVLSVVLFVSAAIPIYLMARIVLRSQARAVAAALLSVAVPWLALTSALFTENLSYPLFWWAMLAVCWAVWRPSVWRDALALLSIALLVCTRIQFAALLVGYVFALVGVSVWRVGPASGVRRRVAAGARYMARGFPLTLATFIGVLAFLLYAQTSSRWQSHVEEALGTYTNVVIRTGLPNNMAEGLLIELIALALGVGLLPAVVSIAWYLRRIARPKLDRRWVYLCVSGVVLVVFLVLTVYSQGGYLGNLTEERYFFYVVPVFWIGAFAALQDGDVRSSELLACSVALALLYGVIPFLPALTQETAFLSPVEAVVPHVLTQRLAELGLTGLTIEDALALIVLLAGIATALLWSRRPRTRAWWTVGAAAALQLLLAGYTYAVIDGKVHGIPGRTAGSVSALGWVDAHAGSANVAWLDNLSTAAPPTTTASPAADQVRTTLFWNTHLRSWVQLPEIGLPIPEWPLAALPNGTIAPIDQRSGQVTAALTEAGLKGSVSEVVGATDSPFLQLAGATLARSPDGVLTLTRLAAPARASWLATGLQPDGYVGAGAPVRLFAFAQSAPVPRAILVTLTLSPPTAPGPPVHAEMAMRLGSSRRRITLRPPPAPPQLVGVPVCLGPGQTAVSGELTATRTVALPGRSVAGMLTHVTISPAGSNVRCP